jgi:HTH-type transcriptional regulator / antitoxin HigA
MDDFNPDWVSPPGDTIAAVLKERDISEESFAQSMRLSVVEVKELLAGEKPISDEMAVLLASVLGSTSRFWMRREARYRSDLIRLGKKGGKP